MKILLPVDGSKTSVNSAKYVVKLVSGLRAKCMVTLISVHDDVSLRHVKTFVAKNVVEDYLREVSEKELKATRKVFDDAGVKHDIVIKQGNISKEILAIANKEKFDLIVMGSKGRGGLLDLAVGSIAQKITSSAKQPVLLVK